MGKITESKNPFTREFGSVARTYIARTLIHTDIERSFIDGITDDRAYFIVGQRGFGKSSLLRAIKDMVQREKEWFVIELRSNNSNLIHEMASALYAIPELKKRFVELQMDFSFIGIGIAIKRDDSKAVTSDETAIKSMLTVVKSMGKKVLIAIDEISNTSALRDLCGMFNVCKGENLPMYMILDGLIKNTEELENVKDLTFLKRVQKLYVGSLDITQINAFYQRYLEMDEPHEKECALKLSKITRGYPYAFQLIGYYTWLWKKEDERLFDRFEDYRDRLFTEIDGNLNSYVYSTIWSELSPTEQDILGIMARYNLTKVKDIREKYDEIFTSRAKMTSSNFSKYRDKLIKNDVLRSPCNTHLEFSLPRFENYAINYSRIDE